MYTVLLSGGSGKRLWPLSNDLLSKQYIKLIKKEIETEESCSMIQRVWSQLEDAGLAKRSIITAGLSQIEIIQSQLNQVNIAVEPRRRDTFPAVVLSCAYLVSKMNASLEDVVVILPVDPFTESLYFETAAKLEAALQQSGAEIALMGALPTYPSEKYGYIIPKEIQEFQTETKAISIQGFIEKPNLEKANELIKQGALWNCGVFCFKINYVLEKAKQYGLSFDYDEIYEQYDKLPKISFDYEVLEKAKSLVMLKFDGIWKDLGTWNTLTEEMNDHNQGWIVWDETSKNSHAINMLDIPMVIMGAQNMVVAASYDGILVADKTQSSYLKDCLDGIEIKPKFEERRWGTIKTLDSTDKMITNKIKVITGRYTSYHVHQNHEELITVTEGRGLLILDGVEQELIYGMTIRIQAGISHAIRAITDLRYVEVLLGTVNQDDIVRHEMVWENIESVK